LAIHVWNNLTAQEQASWRSRTHSNQAGLESFSLPGKLSSFSFSEPQHRKGVYALLTKWTWNHRGSGGPLEKDAIVLAAALYAGYSTAGVDISSHEAARHTKSILQNQLGMAPSRADAILTAALLAGNTAAGNDISSPAGRQKF